MYFFHDGVGSVTEDGLEFTATGLGGEVNGIIKLEEDIATVIILGQEWLDFAGINEYKFYKTSDVPHIYDIYTGIKEERKNKMMNRKRMVTLAVLITVILGTILYLMIIISKNEETGNVVIRYNLFSDYTYEIYDDHIKLIFYKRNNKKTVTIPDTIMGKPVTEIGAYCFSDYYPKIGNFERKYNTVYMGNNVKKIEEGAFTGCEKLIEVLGDMEIPDIEKDAFCGCNYLTTFEPRMVNIGDGAFWACSSLININEESQLESIGNNAFLFCYSLKTIGDHPTLLKVGDGAFSYSGLEEFTVYDQTEFGEDVFAGTPYAESLAE